MILMIMLFINRDCFPCKGHEENCVLIPCTLHVPGEGD